MILSIGDIALSDPIDYSRLEAAFRAANWRWFDPENRGRNIFPTAARIQKSIEGGRREGEGMLMKLSMHDRFVGYCSSGGLSVFEDYVVLDPRLARHYDPQHPNVLFAASLPTAKKGRGQHLKLRLLALLHFRTERRKTEQAPDTEAPEA